MLSVGIRRRRVHPIAIISLVTVAVALAAYALSGGDPLALKLRRGAVTGTMGVALLASVALGRPLLLWVAEHAAQLNAERAPELLARVADRARRRVVTTMTAILGVVFTLDGATQIALAVIVPTSSFVADSTMVRIIVIGTGAVVSIRYLRHQRQRLRPM